MKTRSSLRLAVFAGLLAVAGLSGCTTTQPFQRGKLADFTMRGDRDKLADAMTEHIYFSREASSGGQGVGGGGCGCN